MLYNILQLLIVFSSIIDDLFLIHNLFFQIETVVPGIHRGLKSKIPIILGTIPLASFQPNAPYTDVPVPQSNVAPAESDTSNPNAGGWALPSGDPMGAPLDNLHALYPNIREFLMVYFLLT